MKKSQLKEIITNVVAEKLAEAKGNPSKYGYIVSGKGTDDPVVQMTGYGNMRLSSWKKKVIEDAKDLVKQLETGMWHNAKYLMQPDGILASEINLMHDLLTPKELREQEQQAADVNTAANPPVQNREAEELNKQQLKLSDTSMQIKKLEANIERRSQPVKRANAADERKIADLRRKQGPMVRKIQSLQGNLDKKP